MLNRSASLAMSTSVLKALPGKLDIKRHSPSILYTHQCNDDLARDSPTNKLARVQSSTITPRFALKFVDLIEDLT